MNPKFRQRLDDVENALSDVRSVPWYVYGVAFTPLEGESWDELEDRATRWLNGEDVPGMAKKDPRTREALIFSYENLVNGGHLLTKTISIGDTDSSGTRYEETPNPNPVTVSQTRERLEELTDGMEDVY